METTEAPPSRADDPLFGLPLDVWQFIFDFAPAHQAHS